MGITVGKMMFCGGILGMLLCVTALSLFPKIFAKQKRRLLEQLEKEI